MAGELVSFGIQKLWDLLSQEHELFRGVKDQVEKLKTDLTNLKSFLKDANAKKHTSASVKTCMEVIKEIIFDAEDVIETFILQDQLGKNGDGIKNCIRRFACIIPEHREIALEIESLSKRISKVTVDMETFGVQQNIADANDSQRLRKRLEFSTKYESNLVGLEENVEKLVGYLVEKDDVQVVSMTGMGGLGKTTLARQAFNHESVKKKFDRLAWVCVTQDCDRMNVWRKILQSFRPKEKENVEEIRQMTEDTLQGELFQLLETSKSLIVFDDIWKEEDWDLIKPIFPHKTGSKVLLTSRNESVAGHEETCLNFKPECLSNQDSWTLFKRIAMPIKDASELNRYDKEMEEIGKEMMEHCKGLPMAVRVLGGLLAAKYTVHDWKRVSENIQSHLVGRNNFNDDNNNSFYHVLSLSFQELPSSLKYCFLYLAHFPEDYEINVEDLSYYWAAEEIPRYQDEETIRDVGDSCIEELVRRNMVISERDKTTWRFETCSLHDLMREVCLSKAKEENFLQITGIRSPTAHSQSPSTPRRFVSQNPARLHIEREINNSKVRSLVVVKKDIWGFFWKLSSLSFTRLQLLRVLLLPAVKFKGGKLPYSIGKLIHLRYLHLEAALVSHLPSSLRNLKLLIYLNLNVHGESIAMHNFLTEMKELRYLALPDDMHKKTKLELNHLVNLETLKNFTTKSSSLEDLRGMARLRTLGIILTKETNLETLSASICGLRHLEILEISCNEDIVMKDLTALLKFIDLKQLKLSIWTRLSADQLQFPSCLTSLSLGFNYLEDDPMPVLEKFLHLKEVFLRNVSFCGKRMVCSSGGFPQLQKLLFSDLKEWEDWTLEEGSMPLLHTLSISCCEKLKELPDGLQFITSLKELSVGRMGEEWKKRLLEGGEDYHKVQHIAFVRI
ncbi:hypothetical protein N665_0015s0094 [Sinapis alba]|nr:hypothetical protein N665_0015s0094 [Sinapis alba]